MERETTCRSADVIGYLVTVSVDRQLLSVDRQLLSVDRQLLSVDRQLLSVDRQLRKCRSTVTKCRSTVTKCRLLVKRVTFHVPNGPPYFRYILNYLRTGYLLIPDDKLIRKEILEEAEFYQIRGIVDELCVPPFLGSKILSDDQKEIFVNSWLKRRLDHRHSGFVLLYRASRDGWVASKFHSICDHRGPTVTVVRSGDYIFGGYTEESWDKGKLCMCRCSQALTSIPTPSVAPTPAVPANPVAFYTVFYSIMAVMTIDH